MRAATAPAPMTEKRKHQPGQMGSLRATVPASTEQWFRDLAAYEGISVQAVVAPVLNAYVREQQAGGRGVVPDPHGNARGPVGSR